VELKVKRLNPNAKLPTRAHPGDLGFDVFALDTVCVQAGQTLAIPTGVACEFPVGWGAIIKARSSQGKAGLDVFGGVVDSGYRGEIVVVLHNTSDPQGEGHVIYKAGDKVAQMVLVPVFPGTVEEVTSLGQSARGTDGFGSTGK
jgi:dUTP pyrophosphatase